MRWHKSHVTLTFADAISEAQLEDIRSSSGARYVSRVPPGVQKAYIREKALEFKQSSEPYVGRLLALFAATVPAGGRILELGTGVGVGLAWIVHALADRTDVQVTTIEINGKQAG